MTFNDHGLLELVELLPEALFLEDLEGNIIDVNVEACELLGYEKEELLEMSVESLVPEDAPAFLPNQIDEATSSGKPLETVNIRKDGTELPVELRGRIIGFEGANRMLVSIKDISDGVTAEKKFLKLFERGPEPAMILDGDGRIENANSRFEEVFNYKPEKIKGRNVNDVLVPEEFKEEAKILDEKAKQGYLNYETIRKGKSREFPVSVSATPVTVENETYIMATYKDITERVKAKKELQTEKHLFDSIMTNTDDLVYFKDVEHRFQRVSQSYAELFDLEEEEMIGKTARDFWPEAEEIIEDERRALDGDPVLEREREVTLPDGEKRWYSIYKFPRRDAEGNITGFLGMDRDITARKGTEKELKEARTFLDAALDGLSAHLAIIDDSGEIVKVNEAWREFAEENDLDADQVGEGINYIQVCKNAAGEGSGGAEEFAQGINKVNSGEENIYSQEYPCHSPHEKRWFIGRVTPFPGQERKHLVITHENITERKLVEQALQQERDKLRNLHEAVDRLQHQEKEQEVLDTAVRVAEQMLGFSDCALGIREGNWIVTRALSSNMKPESTRDFKIGEGITGKTFQKAKPSGVTTRITFRKQRLRTQIFSHLSAYP